MKLYTVESGNESWDYDTPDGMPPLCHVEDYWVKCGKEVVKKFGSRGKALEYADALNKATKSIDKDLNRRK